MRAWHVIKAAADQPDGGNVHAAPRKKTREHVGRA